MKTKMKMKMKEKKNVLAAATDITQGAKEKIKWGGSDGASLHRIIYIGAVLIVTFIMSTVEAAAGIYPFGVAMMCAVSGPAAAAAAYSGAVLGTLAMPHGAIWQILVITAAFLARIGAALSEGVFKRGSEGSAGLFCEPGYIRVTVSAAAAAGAGVVTILGGGGLYVSIFSALLGLAVYTLSCAAFMFLASRSAAPSKRLAGVCLAAFALTKAIGTLALPFSPALAVAFAASVYFTWTGGIAYGAAVGISCGIACGGTLAPMFAIGAAVFGLVCDHSIGGAVILAAASGEIWALGIDGLSALGDTFPEICLASAILVPLMRFGVLPCELPPFLNMDMSERGESAAELKMLAAGGKYEAISNSLSSLAKMLFSVCDKMKCPTKEEAYRICTAARAKYCLGCSNASKCSGAECDGFFEAMIKQLGTAGKVNARIVPEDIAKRCYNMDALLDAVNTASKRCANMSAACAKTELFASDYTAVAELLSEVAEAGGDWERDAACENALTHALAAEGFSFAAASVYGSRCRRIYLKGVDISSVRAGERDISRCASRVAGCRMSSPEFSVDRGGVSASMHTVPAIAVKSGRFSTSGKRDDTSGDSICSFKNSDGYYYTLVSDGMGSGRDAALISGISSVFLEKLLSAGCPMRSALEMLNCFVLGSEGERFTTVDLMETDLYTGRARFIKSGAAPSFVIRGGQLYRLHSKTVPIGIMRALDAESISFELKAGDTVIMMSDGVTGSYEDCPWLYELLCSPLVGNTPSPAQAARLIGEAAVKNTGRDDDITVCVMKVTEAV